MRLEDCLRHREGRPLAQLAPYASRFAVPAPLRRRAIAVGDEVAVDFVSFGKYGYLAGSWAATLGLGKTNKAGWSSLTTVDPRKPGEAVLAMPTGADVFRIYPRIEGPGDEVVVCAEGQDGVRRELFALRKAFADGVWSAAGEWSQFALPSGDGWRIVVRLAGENAQLFHQGEMALFPGN